MMKEATDIRIKLLDVGEDIERLLDTTVAKANFAVKNLLEGMY